MPINLTGYLFLIEPVNYLQYDESMLFSDLSSCQKPLIFIIRMLNF